MATAHIDARLRGHVPALDGVRGVAITLVMWAHLALCTRPSNGLERGLLAASQYGLLGVDLFFVLSGFLITGILIDAKSQNAYFRTFYMRRALRIFPLYYGVLALLFWVAPLIPYFQGQSLDFLVSHQAWAWLYGVNIYNAIHGNLSFPYINHFWSLAVEEHFYLVWPLVIWATPSARLRRVCASAVFLALTARLLGAILGLSYTTLYELTPFRIDQLAFGGLLATEARRRDGVTRLAKRMSAAAPAAAAVLVGLFSLDGALHHWGGTANHQLRTAMWTILFGALIVAAIALPDTHLASRFLRSRVMTGLGKYSYGLYVYHHIFSQAFERFQIENAVAVRVGSHSVADPIVIAAGLSCSVLTAIASFHLFEKRFLALKRQRSTPSSEALGPEQDAESRALEARVQ
jgi:peptidoglycan/LPS O-acetylase OafA/YrhL